MNASLLLQQRSRRECDSVLKFLFSALNVDNRPPFRFIRLRDARSIAAPASLPEELLTQKSRKSKQGSEQNFSQR